MKKIFFFVVFFIGFFSYFLGSNPSKFQKFSLKNDYSSIYLSNGNGIVTKKINIPTTIKTDYYLNRTPLNRVVLPNAPTVNQINPKTGGPACGLDLFGKCF
jgi:hypothetical protein